MQEKVVIKYGDKEGEVTMGRLTWGDVVESERFAHTGKGFDQAMQTQFQVLRAMKEVPEGFEKSIEFMNKLDFEEGTKLYEAFNKVNRPSEKVG